VDTIRVPWSSASFLAYLGGFTVLFGAGTFLGVQSDEHGAGGFALAAGLTCAAVGGLAFAARRSGHRVIAGLLAFVFVVTVGVFIGALFAWFGWLPDESESPFGEFNVAVLALELLTTAAAALALFVFRFSLLVFAVAAPAWFFMTDLLSNGGNWSAVVTLLFGMALFLGALLANEGGRTPGAFWLHVVSGLTIGGGLLWFFHESDLDWILVAVAGLVYIAVGDRLVRSSWVVLGAWGLLQTTSHFANKWSEIGEAFFFVFYLFPFVFSFDEFGRPHAHPWVGPLLFAALGVLFFALALLIARRRRDVIPAAELL
jgi:MFS family permease